MTFQICQVGVLMNSNWSHWRSCNSRKGHLAWHYLHGANRKSYLRRDIIFILELENGFGHQRLVTKVIVSLNHQTQVIIRTFQAASTHLVYPKAIFPDLTALEQRFIYCIIPSEIYICCLKSIKLHTQILSLNLYFFVETLNCIKLS